MSTKNDFIASWVNLTKHPLKEVRQRVRVLSEAGLLPDRAQPFTHEDLARALLGFLAADTHKEAAEIVRALSIAKCSHISSGSVLFDDLSLLEFLTFALEKKHKYLSISVRNLDKGVNVSFQVENKKDLENNLNNWKMEYSYYPLFVTKDNSCQINTTKTIYSDLILGLVNDLF